MRLIGIEIKRLVLTHGRGNLLRRKRIDRRTRKLVHARTLLLGLRKPVVKAHGSSDALAFYDAVRQAVNAVEANLTQDIQDNIEKMAVPKELEHGDET